jgi:UDPglucose 6-dehydrogenase
MSNIGIVGYGIVGEAIGYGFGVKNNVIKYYDKYKPSNSLEDVVKSSEFIFVCVPTPYKRDGIDLSIMDESIENISRLSKNSDKIIVIKSTVIPGTTRKYSEKYKKNKFCFNPEFLTESNYLEDFVNSDRVVIGADYDEIKSRVKDLYREIFRKVPIFLTDSKTAEFVKYMGNLFLAMKVIFANEMYDVCEKIGIDYGEVKEIFGADTRIGKSHLNVTPERGFGGKCFPKDMKAFIEFCRKIRVDVPLLETVWGENLKIRKIRDWEGIPFVKSE